MLKNKSLKEKKCTCWQLVVLKFLLIDELSPCWNSYDCSDSLAVAFMKSYLNDLFVETMMLNQTFWLAYQAADPNSVPRIAAAEPSNPPPELFPAQSVVSLPMSFLDGLNPSTQSMTKSQAYTQRPKCWPMQGHILQINRGSDEQNQCLHMNV